MSEESIPPLKKYKQSTLKFHPSVPSNQGQASTFQVEPDIEVHSSQSLGETSSDSLTDPYDCHSKCCEVRPVPFQPLDASAMENTRKQQGKKSRRFSPSWYESFPWLSLCTTRN